jgi:hypothetical protein
VKLALDINQQIELRDKVFSQFDGIDVVTPGVEGGPKVVRKLYNLGGMVRRAIVRNMLALKASLDVFEATKNDIAKDVWATAGKPIPGNPPAEDPENFAKFLGKLGPVLGEKEDIELLPLPAATMYADENAFPTQLVMLLEQYGLIEEPAAA